MVRDRQPVRGGVRRSFVCMNRVGAAHLRVFSRAIPLGRVGGHVGRYHDHSLGPLLPDEKALLLPRAAFGQPRALGQGKVPETGRRISCTVLL